MVDISVNNAKAAAEEQSAGVAPALATMIVEMDRMGWLNEPKTVDWGPDVGSERIQDGE
jgi:antitoxin MazE